MRVIFGTGVLAKDNKTPFAPGTLHALSRDGWNRPARLSFENVAKLLNDPNVVEVSIIDDDNREFNIIKEEVKQRVLHFYPDAKSVMIHDRTWQVRSEAKMRALPPGAELRTGLLGAAGSPAAAWQSALGNIQRERRDAR